jgi:hypothetical protein
MVAPRVFLSHASADAAFANRMADDLRRMGADIWLDSSHIGSGDFVSHINAALAGREHVILVLTRASIQSQWVNREVSAAIARETQGLMRPMIVVMAQACDPSMIPPLWTTYHRYDASADYSGALQAVARQLGLAAAVAGAPAGAAYPVAPAAPVQPVNQRRETSVTFSRLTVATLVTLAIAAVIFSVWASSSDIADQYLGAIFAALVSQAVGLGILWSAGWNTWEMEGRALRHPWLAGGFVAGETLFAMSLYFLAEQAHFSVFNTWSDWLGMIAIPILAIILVTEIVLTAMTRQWLWLIYLLAPLPVLVLALIASAGASIGDQLHTFSFSIFVGAFIAWLFVLLAFALVGPTLATTAPAITSPRVCASGATLGGILAAAVTIVGVTQLIIDDPSFYANSGVLLLVVIGLLAQAAGFAAIWNSFWQSWKLRGNKPSNPWLTGGIVAAEALGAFTVIFVYVFIAYAPSPYADSFGFLYNLLGFSILGLGAVSALASVIVALVKQQWAWFGCIVASLLGLILTIFYLQDHDVEEMIVQVGALMAAVFVIQVFALVGAVPSAP